VSTLQVHSSHLELVDLVVDHIVHLGVEASGKALLGGELVEGRVSEGVLGLVVAAVGVVGIVISIISALSGGIVLELFEIVSETHGD